MLYAVIMAGGTGTRLWPLSRGTQPKQALRLIGDRTMFQHAVDRLAPLFPPERIFVVTNGPLAEVLHPQCPDLPVENFILEPAGRDSAPAAGLAAAHLLARDPDAVMVILTADHYIVDTEQFRAALHAAYQVAEDGTIVTLGIKPAYAATGFGYIHLGNSQIIVDGFHVYDCDGFREKPDPDTANSFYEDGRYVWNSGMFIWRAQRVMDEFGLRMPQSQAALEAIRAGIGTAGYDQTLAAQWPRVQRISIDYGIMEHADRISVIPVDIGWSDIGSWGALLDVLPTDGAGNVVEGQIVLHDTHGSYIRGDGRLIAAIGLQDMVIIDTPVALLVCPRSRAEDVKEIVGQLRASGRTEYL